MDATAIVVAYDSAAVLPDCLAALAKEGVPAVVVDNASRDASAEIADKAGARVIRNARNEGYGRAMNIGLRAAARASLLPLAGEGGVADPHPAAPRPTSPFPGKGEEEPAWELPPPARGRGGVGAGTTAGQPRRLCLLLNPDVVVEPGCVAALLDAAGRYPDAAILAPRLVEPDGRFFFQARSLLAPYLRNEAGRPCFPEGDCCAPFLSGACLLVDGAFVLALGGFDENLFLFYEDDDLCRRVADAGRSLVHVLQAMARHVRGGSSEARRGRALRARWHRAWSAGYVAQKYGLADPSWRTLAVNAAKLCGAALTANRPLLERYGGAAAGALAWLRGRTALAREGLK